MAETKLCSPLNLAFYATGTKATITRVGLLHVENREKRQITITRETVLQHTESLRVNSRVSRFA